MKPVVHLKGLKKLKIKRTNPQLDELYDDGVCGDEAQKRYEQHTSKIDENGTVTYTHHIRNMTPIEKGMNVKMHSTHITLC